MANIGRNDPCPCGSGKKYKKCCLPFYEESIDVNEKKIDALFLLGEYSFSRYKDSFRDVLGKFEMKKLSSIETFNDLLDENEAIYPLEWFMFNEYVSKGKTPLELFLEEGDAPSDIKNFFTNWLSTYWSFYKIEGIFPSINRLDLSDLLLNKAYTVFDPIIERLDIAKGEIIFTRLVPYKSFYIVGYVFFPYWEKDKEKIKRFVDEKIFSLKRGGMSPEDLLRMYGYRLFEEREDILGDTIGREIKSPTSYKAIYSLNDYNKVINLLSLSPFFFRTNSFREGEAFNCIKTPKKRLLLNTLREEEEDLLSGYIGSVIVMKAPENILVGMSDTRENLEDLRSTLEEILKGLIVHQKDTSEFSGEDMEDS
ncbi:MAG: YecA family protein [bacterium]